MALDDVAAPGIRAVPAAPRLRTLKGMRLGFLGNRKRNNGAFLRAIGDEVARREPGVGLQFWEKPSVYRPISGKLAAEILASCDALISGLGD
jgi:hypothetical protein